MKKLLVGAVFGLLLLVAQAATAAPCGLCQAYYPCWYSCEHCVEGFGGPGLWEIDGGCWGDIESGTCGDTGQCNAQLATWGGSEDVAAPIVGDPACAGRPVPPAAGR